VTYRYSQNPAPTRKEKEKGKEIPPRSLETLPKFVSKPNCFRGASKQAF
jgi:hypothetical protein